MWSPRLHVGDALAHLLHHARALVAADERRWPAVERAVLDREVGVAHARRAHADLHLTRVGRLDLDVVTDLERLVHAGQDGGSVRHVLCSTSRVSTG